MKNVEGEKKREKNKEIEMRKKDFKVCFEVWKIFDIIGIEIR